MKTERVKLAKLKVNSENPRTITKDKFEKLINSILVFPRMLEIRPIVVDGDYTALGGNQRTEALNAITKLKICEITDRLSEIADFQRMEKSEQENTIRFWSAWLEDKVVPVINASTLTEDEKKQFIIKDNAGFGEWNWDMLANSWDSALLEDWGLDLPSDWNSGINPDDCGEEFSLPDGNKPNQEKLTFTVSSEQAELIKSCLGSIKNLEDIETFGNENKNGNALYKIVKQWEEQRR